MGGEHNIAGFILFGTNPAQFLFHLGHQGDQVVSSLLVYGDRHVF